MNTDRDPPDRKPPLVTVAMPVYNAGKYLRLAVLSIVGQTFSDWELLIIDDGSTDNALQDIADIVDARIRIIRDGVNKGLAARLNECIDLARGQYIARMDQDDVSFPERFERQVHALQTESGLDLVAVRAMTISGDNLFTGWLPYDKTHQEITARPWRGFYLPHPTWMGRTEWFTRYRYRIPGPYFCEDQELLLRSYRNSHFKMLEEPLFAYRIRDGINWRKHLKTRLVVAQVQLRHFLRCGQVGFAMLAFMVLSGRLLSDLLRFFTGTVQSRVSSESVAAEKMWKFALSRVEKVKVQHEKSC